MPEKPEVITVANTLKTKIIGRTILSASVYWDNTIASSDSNTFCHEIKNQKIENITTRGKWIVITLTDHLLLIHLRMEGKFLFREVGQERGKHEHVIFLLDHNQELRFHDTRKFGKIWLTPKEGAFFRKPLCDLGLEFDDNNLTSDYLYQKFHTRQIPIKTVLLDQSIIAGIGNIYDDEILFLSHLHPMKKANTISKKKCEEMIIHTRDVLNHAISLGGSTIRTYSSAEGVHGLFQNELLVHGKKKCPNCNTDIKKIVVGGRGTYFCPKCQKKR